MYDILHHMSAAMSKKKNTSVTTIIKTEPVKARSSPELLGHNNNHGDMHHLEPASSPIPTSSTSSKLERIRKNRKGNKDKDHNKDNKIQPKSGALAAAMMAATVAGGSNIFDVSKVNQSNNNNNNSRSDSEYESKNKKQKHPVLESNHQKSTTKKVSDDDASSKQDQKSALASSGNIYTNVSFFIFMMIKNKIN